MRGRSEMICRYTSMRDPVEASASTTTVQTLFMLPLTAQVATTSSGARTPFNAWSAAASISHT